MNHGKHGIARKWEEGLTQRRNGRSEEGEGNTGGPESRRQRQRDGKNGSRKGAKTPSGIGGGCRSGRWGKCYRGWGSRGSMAVRGEWLDSGDLERVGSYADPYKS